MKPDEIRNAIDGVVIQWENGVLPKHQSLTDAIADAIIAKGEIRYASPDRIGVWFTTTPCTKVDQRVLVIPLDEGDA